MLVLVLEKLLSPVAVIAGISGCCDVATFSVDPSLSVRPLQTASSMGWSDRRAASPRPPIAQRRRSTFFPCRLRRHSSRSNKVSRRRPALRWAR